MTIEERIIKKYPNRRLYDTAISSYITLDDVKHLVVEQIPIKVIDARTQEDITHSTLLQIIIEQEENGPPLFTTDSLQKLIRLYSLGPMQEMLRPMFEQTMAFFSNQQNILKETLSKNTKGFESDPIRFMSELTQKNVANWQTLQQQLQQQWLQMFSTPQKQSESDETSDKTK